MWECAVCARVDLLDMVRGDETLPAAYFNTLAGQRSFGSVCPHSMLTMLWKFFGHAEEERGAKACECAQGQQPGCPCSQSACVIEVAEELSGHGYFLLRNPNWSLYDWTLLRKNLLK